MSNIINLNQFAIQKEQKKKRAEEEEYAEIEKMVKEVMDANPPEPPQPIWLYSEQEAEKYLKANNLDLAIMKLMDVTILLESCGKNEESKIINAMAGRLLGIEDYE